MVNRKRRNSGGRMTPGTFSVIPHYVIDSHNWRSCSGSALKLLLELIRQYRGRNNGDLCAAWTTMAKRGWRSKETLHMALLELRHYGLIELTRQGGLHRPSLYALTWRPIDDCKGKLDCRPTAIASAAWSQPRERFQRPARDRKPSTDSVASRYGPRSDQAES